MTAYKAPLCTREPITRLFILAITQANGLQFMKTLFSIHARKRDSRLLAINSLLRGNSKKPIFVMKIGFKALLK